MSIMDLSENDMTIAEFASLVGMTPSALRHYDKAGVFLPIRHGIEFQNNYRFYSPMQITVVKMVRVLSEIGVPLKVIKELAQDRTPGKLIRLLSRERDKVADEIRFLNDVHLVIDTFIDLLHEGLSITESEISVTEMPERRIILGEVTDFSGTTSFIREFIRFCSASHVPKLNTSYPIGGYFDDMTAFLQEPSQPTRFFSIDPNGCEQKSAGLYLNGYTRGYYGQTNDLPQQMAAFAKKNGLVFSVPVYNTYLFDELSIANPEQYLLQVSASVTETRRVHSRRPRRRK